MPAPACTCLDAIATGHMPKCPRITWLADPDYSDDLELPSFLRRKTKTKPPAPTNAFD